MVTRRRLIQTWRGTLHNGWPSGFSSIKGQVLYRRNGALTLAKCHSEPKDAKGPCVSNLHHWCIFCKDDLFTGVPAGPSRLGIVEVTDDVSIFHVFVEAPGD